MRKLTQTQGKNDACQICLKPTDGRTLCTACIEQLAIEKSRAITDARELAQWVADYRRRNAERIHRL